MGVIFFKLHNFS